MKSLCQLPLLELRKKLGAKKLSPQELWAECQKAIAEKDGKIHAFLTHILQLQLPAEWQKTELKGIPFAVKDNLSTANLLTTAGSQILKGYRPPYTATVVERLQKAGGVILGKTNCDAFAFGASGENSGYGPTHNPYDLSRVPGGSSSGSAAAVAAGMAVFALGTDTGGSIRQPAAFCGVVGLKPTYGRCSRWGLIAMGSSFDVPGPLTRTVADAAFLLGLMAGYDKRDATSSQTPVENYLAALNGSSVRGLRVGLVEEFFQHGLQPEIKKAVMRVADVLANNGAKLVRVHLPHLEEALAVYYVLVPAEISSNMARYDGIRFGWQSKRGKTAAAVTAFSRAEGFEMEVKRRILTGTYVLSAGYYDAYYLQASRVRTLVIQDFQELFNKVDVLLGPTTPTTAFKLGEKTADPVAMYLSDIFTVPANVAGLPAISLPFGRDQKNLPIGVQLIGNRFQEGEILRVAHFLENYAC